MRPSSGADDSARRNMDEGPGSARGGAPDTIRCVDCGGVCHLLSYRPDEGFEPGTVVAYRCADCGDRWDIELDDDDLG